MLNKQVNTVGFMAISQHGETIHLKTAFPRKELMEHYGMRSARKMYQDAKGGLTRHVGYIIAGNWLSVYRVGRWKDAR